MFSSRFRNVFASETRFFSSLLAWETLFCTYDKRSCSVSVGPFTGLRKMANPDAFLPKFVIFSWPTFLSSSFTTHSVSFLLTFIILVASSLVKLSVFFILHLASPGGKNEPFQVTFCNQSRVYPMHFNCTNRFPYTSFAIPFLHAELPVVYHPLFLKIPQFAVGIMDRRWIRVVQPRRTIYPKGSCFLPCSLPYCVVQGS